jgi:hypothetical protein
MFGQSPASPWRALLFGMPGMRNATIYTFEEQLFDRLDGFGLQFGRVIAVGRPGEKLPFPGAEKVYLPGEGWQPIVSELISRARLAVLIAAPGPGTLWDSPKPYISYAQPN